ncbi:MAG: ABC transporter permease [Burkholderiaceae bacterium]
MRLASLLLAKTLWRHRNVLWATTRLELQKKYAGSFLGYGWIVLHPLLFLATYVVVFVLIFRVTLPGQSGLGYVLFLFCGLIPFLTFMEVATSAAVAIRQNMHLLKNVIAPVEIIPARVVALALVAQGVGLALCLAFAAYEGSWSPRILALPLLLTVAGVFYTGLAMTIAPIGMVFPDLAHGMGIAVNLLMFVSPIAFRRDMVPDLVKFLVDYNPVAYLFEGYRSVLLATHEPDWKALGILVLIAIVTFELGAQITMKFKSSVVDYE